MATLKQHIQELEKKMNSWSEGIAEATKDSTKIDLAKVKNVGMEVKKSVTEEYDGSLKKIKLILKEHSVFHREKIGRFDE